MLLRRIYQFYPEKSLSSNIFIRVAGVEFHNNAKENARDAKVYDKYFRALELEPGSSKDLVRRQYIKLVKKYHPDAAVTEQEKDLNLKEFQKVDEVNYLPVFMKSNFCFTLFYNFLHTGIQGASKEVHPRLYTFFNKCYIF